MTQITDAAILDEPKNRKVQQTHHRTNEKDLPKFSFTIRLIDSVDELESLCASWQRLSDLAIRQNLFFEPGFLIPAFKHLNPGNVRILAIEAPQRVAPDAPRVLCGLLPVVTRRFYGIPLSCLEIWKHDQCFDCTPLIRNDCAKEVLAFLFKSMGSDLNTSLFSLNTVAGDGEFQSVLTDVLSELATVVFQREAFNRACFTPMENAESYIKTKVSKSTRKNTLRMQRKLETTWNVKYATFQSGDSTSRWIKEFLDLESAGWKGKSQTALAAQNHSRAFFVEIAERLMPTQNMSMTRVSVDDRPICMLCDIQKGEYGIAFKTAFDESFAEYSPGLIAEFRNIERLHELGVQQMDSCAIPDHPMINRVWKDRMRYQSFVVALGGHVSRFTTASMPLIQTASKLFKKQELQDDSKAKLCESNVDA